MPGAHSAPGNDWPGLMLRRVDASLNMSLFWSARLQPSLFDEVILVRNWGRIGSCGQERAYWFSTSKAALAAFEKITAAKRRSGYAAQAGAQPHIDVHEATSRDRVFADQAGAGGLSETSEPLRATT